MKFLTGPFSANNPVIVQILGICSALAVTVQLKPAIVMALSVTVVTGFSNLVMSLLRNGVPSRIRIIVQLVVIAALVILVDQCSRLCLRGVEAAVCLCRPYHHQLYRHGTYRGIRAG